MQNNANIMVQRIQIPYKQVLTGLISVDNVELEFFSNVIIVQISVDIASKTKIDTAINSMYYYN